MKKLKVCTAIFFCTILCTSVFAIDYDWRTKSYQHVSINEGLVQLLESFASEQGFALVLSEKIQGRDMQRVNANFKTTSEEFLNKISALYSLLWFYDGQVLYFYDAGEQVSELVDTNVDNATKTKQTMIKMGIWDERYRWMMLKEEGLLHVHGPPAYIDIIKHLVARFERSANLLEARLQQEALNNKVQKTHEHELKVFPLQYAWAADQYFDDGQGQRLIEGVVTKLRRIFHADPVLNSQQLPRGGNQLDIRKQNELLKRLETLDRKSVV